MHFKGAGHLTTAHAVLEHFGPVLTGESVVMSGAPRL